MNLGRNLIMWVVIVWVLGIPAATTVTAVPLVGQPAPDFNLTLFSGGKSFAQELSRQRGHHKFLALDVFSLPTGGSRPRGSI